MAISRLAFAFCTLVMITTVKNQKQFPAKQFRIARPTDRLKAVTEFYTKGLGLHVIDHFENHSGYDGVMIGLPDARYHLEFTHHINGSPGPAPSRDNLLVLYFENDQEIKQIVQRLTSMNYFEVEPENPYWRANAVTFEDPDGWRVVLYEGKF